MFKKRYIIIFLSVFLFVVLIVIMSISFSSKSGQVVINNFDEIVKNISSERKEMIFKSLFYKIKLTNKNPNNIIDAQIRNNSSTQSYHDADLLYYGDFIVDIPSIQQSYFVQYNDTKDKEKEPRYRNSVSIKCVDKEEIIYSDFNCAQNSNSSQPDDFISSSIYLEYINPISDILTFKTKNQVELTLTSFSKETLNKKIKIARITKCTDPTIIKDYYECSVSIEPEEIIFKLFVDERLNPVQYIFEYGSKSKEYIISES